MRYAAPPRGPLSRPLAWSLAGNAARLSARLGVSTGTDTGLHAQFATGVPAGRTRLTTDNACAPVRIPGTRLRGTTIDGYTRREMVPACRHAPVLPAQYIPGGTL